MTSVGLRGLRQDASAIVRRAERGEEIDITVSGRIAARMVPATASQWQRWEEVADIFTGAPDPDWNSDRDLVDQSISDPWDSRT